MRSLRYNVAVSLDGYIAPHDGSTDWITPDPSIDFDALWAEFDTFIMGRKSYEDIKGTEVEERLLRHPASNVLIVSKTLIPEENPGVTIVSGDFLFAIRRQKEKEGSDLWLFGGGELFGACLDAGLVDTAEVAIMPTLLRGGVKLSTETGDGGSRAGQKLELQRVEKLEGSGILMCVYQVVYPAS
ncbi:uncharacterized protein DNG_00066 [Cephalotrichum gorgonifer]|uniref:2,5-diamino-6-ribosylamino-4(3H)-pyrimidinone 5'-phosphate reductase n=1 Tax=Cephalotrichum gorgonifer TaxID=2041049 RepID=A0AAE8MNM7_9PEZI|nr:uncharacterized protein DNG_00066 [Cephalotrichum gorgonifer]